MSSLCILRRIEIGWWCSVCDPKQERILPVDAARKCQKGMPPYREQGKSIATDKYKSLSSREHIEYETTFFVNQGTAKRTAEQIANTLDKCFGGCRYLEGNCTAWVNASSSNCDKRRAAWIEHIIHNECELWKETDLQGISKNKSDPRQ